MVRDYLSKFNAGKRDVVLDPFCGTGTTLVECKKLGIESYGIEPNPFAHFACITKVNWDPNPAKLIQHSEIIADDARNALYAQGINAESDLPLFANNGFDENMLYSLPKESAKLLIGNSISPMPLHKTLVLLEKIDKYRNNHYYHHERLALAKALVFEISNLHFGPEVGVTRTKKLDVPVIDIWLKIIRTMANDLDLFRALNGTQAMAYLDDARSFKKEQFAKRIDIVITSPPYPNEKDYTRTTRLESVLLGFIKNRDDLKKMKQNFIRSNTRAVYKKDSDDLFISNNKEVNGIAERIENKRIELGKTSGFERLYARVTKLYFGGMARHLEELKRILNPGARLAYVVGDQASYFRIMINTGNLLAEIAESQGYKVLDIDLFRTRLSTTTKKQLREEVLLLEWNGK